MDTIAITGAGGNVGRAIRPILGERWRLRLFDRAPIAELGPNEEGIVGDIADEAALRQAFAGVSGVVHMAGCTSEEDIDAQIAGNVKGAWNVFEAARAAGVERVVYTSSHHVVGHYPRYRRVGREAIIRPDSRYGLTKAFGEQAGAFYADQFGLRVMTIRVGYLGDRPLDRRRLAIWISPRDLAQLIAIGLTHAALRYALVYGVSANTRSFFDNPEAFRLGYRPQDSADAYATEIEATVPPENPALVSSKVVGGAMADQGYQGDIGRVDEW